MEPNTPEASDPQREAMFALVCDVCHWLATGRQFEEFLSGYTYDPPTCELLRGVYPMLAANVEFWVRSSSG